MKNRGQRILICGGTGLIGSALASDLACDGYEVIILSRHHQSLNGLPAGVRFEKWDAQTAGDWYPLAEGAAAIVNLAGENIGSGRWTEQRKRAILQSRLESGQAIVQAVEKSAIKPRVLIQASAVGYYGPSTDKSFTEINPPGHDYLARVVLDWEASTQPVERLGVRRVIIRTGVVLSKNGGVLPRIVKPFRFFAGGRLGHGCQWFPWIHIHDEISAIRFLLENDDVSGPFNLTAPCPVNNAEFSRLLARQIKRPSYFSVPALALRMMFGEMATIFLDGQLVVPARLSQIGFVFRFPEIREALKDLLD